MENRDINIKVKSTHEMLVVFHDLTNYDSHLVMSELGKAGFKINVPNGLEKVMTFNKNYDV